MVHKYLVIRNKKYVCCILHVFFSFCFNHYCMNVLIITVCMLMYVKPLLPNFCRFFGIFLGLNLVFYMLSSTRFQSVLH